MTAFEFKQWQAFDLLDPIGGFRHDLQTAHLLYANHGKPNQSIMDFLPIDPNPMTDIDRQNYAKQQLQIQAKAEVAQMIGMFNRRSA